MRLNLKLNVPPPLKRTKSIRPESVLNTYSNSRTPITSFRNNSFKTRTVSSNNCLSVQTLNQPRPSLCSGSIDNYSVLKTIGKGAYAVVKEACYLPTKQRFAVKSYEKTILISPNKKRNMIREIQILKQLNHPNLIFLKEAIDDLRHVHLVMELVEGISLKFYIKQFPLNTLPEDKAKVIFRQLLSGISYCHSKFITHRDIKLDNILVDEQLNVKIVDFGFSTCIPENRPYRVFCGTPSYMAPEIVLKKEFKGPPADVWALGILLFVVLVGFFPFKGINDRDLYRKILRGSFDIPDSVSQDAKTMIFRMTQLDPNKRPTADELLSSPWLINNS